MTIRNLAAGYISLEVATMVLRYHPDGAGYGSPWDCSCLIQLHGNEATIFGLAGKFSATTRRKLKEALLALGVTHTRWERRNTGALRAIKKSS